MNILVKITGKPGISLTGEEDEMPVGIRIFSLKSTQRITPHLIDGRRLTLGFYVFLTNITKEKQLSEQLTATKH